ncbi:multicopper oxidase [Plakobranchus ocellatus]|uniref:Multicopper oxidase n=1 Tax=Plakobranchus ocellatus TaxID=259542 RepID=A0AAV4AI53_9GAST|nr:multicopper oxidase [Plakobranchus ocellatus]
MTDCARPHCIAADGGLRGLLTANRMMPGPGIHVCEGDTIRVRVHNKMENSESVTLHWHGVLQEGTPYMDGVAMVTQCPIPPHTAFTYVFKADTPGTHFWHAHSGLQRGDGLYGNLVIRRFPDREPHILLYDYDLPQHTLVVHDWWNRDIASTFAQHHHSDGTNKPDSLLINGKGLFHEIQNKETGENSTTPREVFEVVQGSRYRFRVASNGIMNCPIKISVDDHLMQIVASDGYSVEPVEVQYFNIFAGERFDFILTANQSVGNYLLRAQGELDCGPLFKNAQQTAILHYSGASRDSHYWIPPPSLNGKGLNPINRRGSDAEITVHHLKSVAKEDRDDLSLKRIPDHKIVLAMDFTVINNPRFHDKDFYSVDQFPIGNKNLQTPQINNITNMFPPSPALTQLDRISKDMFCNNETLRDRDCAEDLCECVHFYHVNLGDVVELILVDQGHIWDTANHPTHLHGHGFRVIAMDKVN